MEAAGCRGQDNISAAVRGCLKVNRRMHVLIRLVITSALLAALSSVTRATETHATTGSSGTHSSTYHDDNPGHVWLTFGADHGGKVTSGGRLHDGCESGAAACHPAMGGDWALDIGDKNAQDVPLHSASLLYVDFLGYSVDAYNTAPVDFSKDIKLEMRVDYEANFRGTNRVFLDPAYPGCNYQKYGIYVTYTDTSGTPRNRRPVGWVGLAHLDNWQYRQSSTNWIQPTASRASGSGGTIWWFNGLQVGNVYTLADPSGCTTAAHSHIEFRSNHSYGDAIEFHSKDARSQVFDGYVDMSPVSNHVMLGQGGNDPANVYTDTGDSVSAGQYFGDLGGGTTSFYMRNLYH